MDDWANLMCFIWAVSLTEAIYAHTKYRQMKLHHFWLLGNKSHIFIPLVHICTVLCLYSLHLLLLPCFCLFSFCLLYFLPCSLFRLHTFHIPSLTLLSYLSYFPLELSLHTIANNPVKESHLCSHAFSTNSPFFPLSSHHWSLYFYILVS